MSADIKTTIVHSDSLNPWYNLALEEYLLNQVSSQEVILYLWQNQNTVVIGSNQNPWKECRCNDLEKDGGKLARRLSGGGAVFHDLGNLNFTFIASRDRFNIEKQLKVILDAVRNFDIDAEFSGRNDIVVKNKKFSGNAFYYSEKGCYHHGTLLVDVNLNKLSKYLQVSKEKIQSKGIDSVESRVVNLKSINENITIEALKQSIKDTFLKIYDGEGTEFIPDKNNSTLKHVYDKYSSWQWIYGESPCFDLSLRNRFSWGELELCFSLKNAHIKKVKVFSDSLDNSMIPYIEKCILGIPFDIKRIAEIINNLNFPGINEKIQSDIYNWLILKSLDM